ncbi:MAG: carbon storage regulator [Thermoguttaceae bacterium]|nr:carbon storage regulator [Thermoguttaceae bacterium]MDO4858955.1 carbon storage regulator [Thermoguttaceae bacterium]
MLVLSRKESERIRVGDSIVVTVVRLTKDRVRLGIEAPDDVLVLRDELEKDSNPDTISEPKKPALKAAAGTAPLARKMSAFSNRQPAPNYSVALEDEPENQPGLETPKLRRCPERKFFRCD